MKIYARTATSSKMVQISCIDGSKAGRLLQ
jgi:hypothetical protein